MKAREIMKTTKILGVISEEHNITLVEKERISRRPPRPRGHIEHHAGQLNRYALRVNG